MKKTTHATLAKICVSIYAAAEDILIRPGEYFMRSGLSVPEEQHALECVCVC